MQAPPGFRMYGDRRRWFVVRDGEEGALEPLMRLPIEALARRPDAVRLTSGRARPVVLPAASGGFRVVVRPYAHGGLLGPILGKTFLGPGRALRELAVVGRAHAAGLPVPDMVGVSGSRLGPFWRLEAWVRWIEDALTVPGRLADRAGPTEVRAVFRALAVALRRCHDAGLVHADLNARNVLVRGPAGSPQAILVDLDRARWRDAVAPGKRAAQLGRLYRSLNKEGLIPGSIPDDAFTELLDAYYGGSRSAAQLHSLLAGFRRSVKLHALLWRRTEPR